MANNINIILNSANYDSSRDVFSYRLPIPQTFVNRKVALSYCSIYKQFNNISLEYNNSKITITWIDGVDYDITIPDGNYTISQINNFLQFYMVTNKLYLIDASNPTSLLFYLELVTNPTLYGSQFNFYPVPNAQLATTLGFIKPDGATWSLPSSKKNLQISFNADFGSLIGFSGGNYGDAPHTNTSVNSDKTPQIAKVNSLLIRSNLVNNEITIIPDILSAMDLAGDYGDLLVKSIGQLLYSNISANNFSEIIVYFSDQNFNKLKIKDTEVCINLSIVDI